MFSSLKLLLAALLGKSIGRMMAGAGLGFASFAAMAAAINGALSVVSGYLGGLTADMAAIIGMSGAGTALSMVGSAVLARNAIRSQVVALARVAK